MNKANKDNVVYLTKRNNKVKSEAKINDAVRSMAFVILGLFSVYRSVKFGAIKAHSNGVDYIQLGCWRDRAINYTFYDVKNESIINQNKGNGPKVPPELVEQATHISFKFAYDVAYESMKKAYAYMGVEFIDCALVEFNRILKIACLDCLDSDCHKNKDNANFMQVLLKCKVECNKDVFEYLSGEYARKAEFVNAMHGILGMLGDLNEFLYK